MFEFLDRLITIALPRELEIFRESIIKVLMEEVTIL